MKSMLGKIHNGDCIQGMNALPAGSVDLVFADPPFNIGYKYDVYEDRMAAEEYLQWSHNWMQAVHQVLKPDGTFWLAIGDDFAAELKVEAQKIGFHCRSWVIWYYTFGVNCKNKFTRSHTHLFHFIKDPKKFTFRDDDLKNRVPSARALVYGDKRALGKGRLPDDTWIIPPAKGEDADEWLMQQVAEQDDSIPQTFALRPQELDGRFAANEDTWYFARVAGTFKERAGFHGCQMPEQLLARIVRTCSHEDDIVLDPFSGSASTLVVAKKLGRKHLGFELSPEYTAAGQARLDATSIGDRLDGSPEPTMEAFQVQQRKDPQKSKSRWQSSASFADNTAADVEALDRQKTIQAMERGITAAYLSAHDGFSTDRVIADPQLNEQFVDQCRQLGLPGSPRVWNHTLLRLRKRSGGTDLKSTRSFSISFNDCEPFLFASEIAWKELIQEERATSLDEILCDPFLAARFDEIAAEFAPGFTSLQYRWGALRLRKFAVVARHEAQTIRQANAVPKKIGRRLSIEDLAADRVPATSGVYLLSNQDQRTLYIGCALDIKRRLLELLDTDRRQLWIDTPESLRLQFFQTGDAQKELLGWTSCFLGQSTTLPRFNIPVLQATS
jgi:site-specific DNA-methyltransferase (adenine-specific)